MKFEQYHISSGIKRNLAEQGFIRPTDIQYKAIPPILRGEDLLAIAQTGTGKTAAFAIPVIDKIHRFKLSARVSGINCVVLAPTRELVRQIGQVFASLARHTRVKVFSLHGGVEQDEQIRALHKGIDVLIATPGRMFDLAHQGFIDLHGVRILVLDEADRMLDQGFINDIKYVKKLITGHHQTLFFSATINPEIKKLAFSQIRGSAIRIQIAPDDPVSRNVSHFVMFVEMDDKRFFLQRFFSDHPGKKVIVFVRTRVRAERVVKAMERVNIPVCVIHGEKEQQERTEVMGKFKSGAAHILIATDVSARGIDIPDVDFVINYDLPAIPGNYVHRIGRTGRGTRKGSAISFCSQEERGLLEEIEKTLGKKIEVIGIDKKEYVFTVNTYDTTKNLEQLIEETEALVAQKKKKRSGRYTGR